MKRSNSLTEEQFLKEPGRSFANKHHLEDRQSLILVTNLDSLEIAFSNSIANRYLHQGKSNSFRKKGEDLYKNFIHPEDYPGFLLHLHSLQNMLPGAVEEITIRLKGTPRSSKKFNFKHRLYFGQKGHYIIGIAKEIPGTGKTHRNSLPNPSLERALLKSMKRNRLLLDNIKDGFCLIDVLFDSKKNPVDYIFLETNTAFEQQMNLDNVLERTIKEKAPEYQEYWLQIFGRVASGKEPLKFQSSVKNKFFDVHAFPVGEEEDGHVGILFSRVPPENHQEEELPRSTSNIDEGTNPETIELKKNYNLLKTIFDQTSVGIAVLEPVYEKNGDLVDFVYVKANDYVLQALRINPVGKSYLRINPDSEENGVFSTYKRTIFSGIPEEIEVKKILKGQKFWYRITTRREKGLLITSIEDISRRKAKSQRLKENIRFKKQIAETSPDIIMILNLQEENVRYINRDMADQPGMRKKDIDGMSMAGIIPFIHPYDRDKVMDFHTRITKAKDREILDLEFRFKTGENQWEWFNARGKVFMRNRESNVCEYILLLRNIEEQKRTQQALLLAEKLSIKGEVARTLAHELRNPMASIGMAADILSKKTVGEENAELKNYIGVIRRSTDVLNKLVTDLLTSSNYSPFSPVKCCLAETLEKALKAAGDRIYLVGIKVVKEYSGTYDILADPEKLKIALLNIIVNASEAMNPNEGILHLKITRNRKNHTLTITDNGCGMEETQLEKLFDAFYTQKAHGVGIGLSSVKSILEEHHAKILVESELNKGTSFHLTFHRYETLERT